MAECSICKSPVHSSLRLPCGHVFHPFCLGDAKYCPDCGSPTGLELFQFFEYLQCSSCNWDPVKMCSLTSDNLSVVYVFNQHCKACTHRCHYFNKFPRSFTRIRYSMKHRNVRNPFPGVMYYDFPEREYHSYDCLYCKACRNEVFSFHAQDLETLEKHDPQAKAVSNRPRHHTCSECKDLTWGNVKQKTVQILPECGKCHEIVQMDELFWKMCCPVVPLHKKCSWNDVNCPTCGSDCVIRFEVSRMDPSMKGSFLTKTDDFDETKKMHIPLYLPDGQHRCSRGTECLFHAWREMMARQENNKVTESTNNPDMS